MKKSILCVLFFFPFILHSQKLSKEAQDYKDLVMKYANDYLTPLQIDILENNYCGPECYIRYVGGKYVPWNKVITDTEVLDFIGSIVHESTHHFNDEDMYVVSETEAIYIMSTPIFKSKLIVNDMVKTNEKVVDMFRFDNYVNTDRSMASSVDGIYGLMNEYCAYYNGALTSLILYEVFKEKSSEDAEEEQMLRDIERELAMCAMSSSTAFYEFNAFIGAYLIYAKKNRDGIYKKILDNSSLVKAYSIVTDNFSDVVVKIHKYFPDHNFKREWRYDDGGSVSSTWGSNEILLLSQEIFNDYVDVLNDFSTSEKLLNPTNLILTKD